MAAVETKRVYIDWDEMYPVHFLEEPKGNGDDVDIPIELYERFKKAEAEFVAVNQILRDLVP